MVDVITHQPLTDSFFLFLRPFLPFNGHQKKNGTRSPIHPRLIPFGNRPRTFFSILLSLNTSPCLHLRGRTQLPSRLTISKLDSPS